MLRAALLPGEAGEAAARDWLASADFQRLGKASRGILPILYERLRRDSISTPLMPVLKGIKRHTWYSNRRLFHHGGEVVRLLKQAGFDVMVVKGVAMAIAYYHDEAMRPMDNLDILVRHHDKRACVQLLMEHDWAINDAHRATDEFAREQLYEIGNGLSFSHASGSRLDLHWNLTHYCLGDVADNDYWAAAGECKFEGQLVKILNPADQLLHVLVQGAPWSASSPVRWIPDAVAILNLHPELNWERVIKQARQRSLTFMVQKTLLYLNGNFHDLVPPHVLSALDGQAPTLFARMEYWTLRQPPRGSLRSILRILFDYLRYSKDRSLHRIVCGLPRYLKIRSGANRWYEFGSIALVKLGRHQSRSSS
jgi:hypothetical protein